MSELNWYWAYIPYLDTPEKQKESAIRAGYIKVVSKAKADKVIAHQKRKRCLAMAKWCKFYADTLRVKRNQCRYYEAELAESYYIRCRRYRRWYLVWLELAEKLKPNKEADDGND